MTFDDIYSQLLDKFGDQTITGKNAEAIDPWIEVAPVDIAEVADYLKDNESLRFDSLNDLSAVDYHETDDKLAKKFPYDSHIAVVYHLYSYTHKHWLTVKVKLPRWQNGVEGQIPDVPTVSHVWAIANWHEREAYDLMGINFTGHPNLVRILCTDDWVGHPLRKDYEFPLEYHGIRGK